MELDIDRKIFKVIAAAALAGASLPAFSYKPLYENIDNLPLEDNRLAWHVWVPGESDDGDAWDPLFHDSVRYWNAEIPWFNLSATTLNNEDCTNGSSRNQVNTATWRETNCGGGSMLHAAGWAQTFLSGFGDARVIDEGDVYFNETFEHAEGGAEQMVFDETSFYSVALHEIGHNLGLGHGYIDAAIMAYGPTHSSGRWRMRLSPDDICGVAVISGNREYCPVALGEAVTSNGATTQAHFSGYASADAGATAREALRPWQEFNIYTTVLIDPAHRYRPGKLHVIAETESGEYFARNADGEWHPWTGGELPAATPPGNLEHAMELVILGRNGISRGQPTFDTRHGYSLYREALTGIRLGLEGVRLKFWVAYSSEVDPDLLIYGSEPIRVAWTLE
ncbi:MAG: matrixin family metalloprotease [Gammaproteobacteria bacterium]|nr:matrixin family metalloprotease [Gammaproteobacteria bacterium]